MLLPQQQWLLGLLLPELPPAGGAAPGGAAARGAAVAASFLGRGAAAASQSADWLFPVPTHFGPGRAAELPSLLAGLGGVIMASQLKSGSATYGNMYELYVIAAVVVLISTEVNGVT